MIATNRRMPAHDFLLVAFSVAVIVLSHWPETQPRQWVQLRQPDGSLRQYSLAENDPTLAKLRLGLEKWAKAGQETRLAVAQWRAELADFYLAKTEAAPAPSSNPIRAVAFRRDASVSEQVPQATAASIQGVLDSQRAYWQAVGQQARRDVARIEEIRRSRKELEVPPPIVFGSMEPGRKPARAIVLSPLIGVLISLGFAAWTVVCPTLRLKGPSEIPENTPAGNRTKASAELRLVVPQHWVRVRQPLGVLARWGAMATLAMSALVSILV